jgi:hypothetical protein
MAEENRNNEALNALQNLGLMEKQPELQSMLEEKFKAPEENTDNSQQTSNSTDGAEEKIEETETLDAPKDVLKGESNEEEDFIESDIFGGKIPAVKKEEKKEEVSLESLDQLNSHLKDNFGIEDMSALGQQINSWKEQEKVLGEATSKLANAEKLFESMPPDLYQLVELHVNGADWKQGLTNPALNFERKIEDYKEKELIDVFFPGEVTNDDWEEFNDEDGDPKTKRLINTLVNQSKTKFEETKSQRKEQATNAVKIAKESQERYLKSAENSSKKLSSQIEGVDSNYIKGIESQLKTPNSVIDLFYEKDGTLKEDAALAYAMAKDGYGLLNQYKKVIQNKTETKVNQDLLLRGSSTPTGSKGSQSANKEVRPEVQAEIDSIMGLVKKR